MSNGAQALINRETGEILDAAVAPPGISPQYIAEQEKSLVLLQQLTRSILVEGRDYGHISGIVGKGLWDPGAQLIIGAFNCHIGQRRILSMTNTDEKVAVVVEVPLINNMSGREVGSGIGASSTMETKHKYRWITSLAEWGYDAEAAKQLKQKVEEGKTSYRIPNPEPGDLLNIIVKQASKRAEVDAAQALPGTASALRELFDLRIRRDGQQAPPARREPDWAGFWGRVAQMGLAEADVHGMLGVKSVNEWLGQGKDLDEAIKTLARKMADRSAAAAGHGAPAGGLPGASAALKRDPSTLKDWTALYKACHEDWGMQPAEVIKELGYSSQSQVPMSLETVYRSIAAVKA